ncbi:MAG TPA: AMP-binding protein [Nitrososphaerales archaeon]|nr:AMP-binding protein [Nitrososphaerales archaeon]
MLDAINNLERGDYQALTESKIDVPEYFNWTQELFESVHTKRNPNKTALLWTDQRGNETKYTFLELAGRSNKFLNLLREKGLSKDDSIFVMLPVLPEIWLSYLTAIKGGFVLIPAATILTAEDIAYRFNQFFPSVVVTDSSGAERIDAAIKILGKEVRFKIIVGGKRDQWIRVEEIDSHSDLAKPEKTKSHDRLLIFFTSGTTGLPKMAVHTHESYPIGHLTTATWLGVKSNDVHYNISQPGWAKFAWSSFFAPWLMGATIFGHHYAGRFVAKEQLKLLEKYHVSTFCAPPTVWRTLILEDLSSYRFKLREVVSAGEPLNPEVIVSWKKSTGLTLRDGYGQTESTLIAGNLPGSDVKLGSMGRPVFPYDVAIVDENGIELVPNAEGKIAVRLRPRPTGLFLGYVGARDERALSAFHDDLYFTGDRAYKDIDGRIWFVGRADDVIKASDYRIGPFEVESMLLRHPAVAESAVVGSPHATRGNVVKVFVILKEGYAPSKELADDIFTFSRANLASYKVPRLLEFTPELPKTISGKIRRIELRAKEIELKQRELTVPLEYSFEEIKS